MTETDLVSLQHWVAWSTFAIAFVVGIAMSRSNFCTMGAVSDVVNMGDWTRMRMWLGAIGVAVLGTQLLAWAGLIDPGRSIYAGPRVVWLSNIVGGVMFGFGMVLASGCGTKTLLRAGAGNMKSLVVFVVLGISAYMTLRGLFGVWRTGTVDRVAFELAGGQDLPRLLAGGDEAMRRTLHLALGLVVGGALLAFALVSREFRRADNLLGALVVGAGIVAVWYVSGHVGFVEEHPRTLEETFVGTNSGRMESLSYVAPMAFALELLMFWSDATKFVSLGIASVLGLVAGAAAHAFATRSFRLEGFQGAEDTANHLVGGVLMGAGGVTALGCTVGQGLSGISTLAVGSLIALLAIVAGSVAGLRYQIWRVERMI
ncbi:MAG TPA: YeeE/YedE family protein [Burkholderiaceae bacterium]|nr:YeeE/YedE family protein [Burkholderiaceae bacterium]